MATRAQQAQLIRDPVFQDQVQGALLAAAAQIFNEDPTAPNHASRRAWANAIYASPEAQARAFMPGMLTNATIAASAGNAPGDSGTPVSDSDVDYVVSSLFNVYATQYAAQGPMQSPLSFGS
jgi:hypothetical protein